MNDYLFVSDIHGEDLNLAEKLFKIAEGSELPKIVFFLGDVVGTKLLDQLQKLFYNRVYNHMKALLKNNPNPSDREIIDYPIGDGKTIADGCKELSDFLQNIDPEYRPVGIATYARELVSYVHYGHFCSNLTKTIKEFIKKDMKENAQVWLEVMNAFIEKGVLVVVIEGNWDARTPLDFMPSKKECLPLPIKNRSFYFKELLRSYNNQILYFDAVGTIETENEIFVLWPFDSAINATQIPEFDDNETRKIVLVSHAQIDWEAIKGKTAMTAEGETIQFNMGMTFIDLKADTAVHGHLHDDINIDNYSYHEKNIHYLPLRTYRFINF